MAALGFLVQLPLALPPLTSGILLLFLVGYGSPLGRLVAGALTDSCAGIVLAEAFVAAPFLIIAARSAFASIDPVLEAVSATLGRGPLDVFFRISLPIARPYILSGLLLSWLRAFGEFGATVMVAYHPYSLPVYTYVAFGAQGLPAMLPILAPTLVIALAMMALNGAVLDRISRPTSRPSRTSLERIAAPELPAAASPKRADTIDLKLRFAKRLGDGCAAARATAKRNARAARRTSAHDHHRHPRSDGSRLARRRNSRARRQVLQSGPTGDLFGRPGNEIVARVLGAETTGEGFVVDKDKIAIGGGATLNVAGPPLRTGERVGWSFSSACARISAAGAYRIVVRFGGTRIWILDGQGTPLRAELCRFGVGPESVQLAPQIGLSCLDFKLW
jgi:ABC-type molybdate transport system permease subunit